MPGLQLVQNGLRDFEIFQSILIVYTKSKYRLGNPLGFDGELACKSQKNLILEVKYASNRRIYCLSSY